MRKTTIDKDVVLPVVCGRGAALRQDCYLVKQIAYGHEVDVLGQPVTLTLHWADGMIGVLPVFDSKEAAEKYAGKERLAGDSSKYDNN